MKHLTWMMVGLVSCLWMAEASAQIRPGDMGMQLETKAGTFGTLCRGFSCTAHVASAARNESVTLTLRGPKDAPFWLFVSPRPLLCATLPGLENQLVLGPPFLFVGAGQLSTQDTIRACPGGKLEIRFAIPFQPNERFTLQAIVMAQWQNGPRPTFTPAIDVGVR